MVAVPVSPVVVPTELLFLSALYFSVHQQPRCWICTLPFGESGCRKYVFCTCFSDDDAESACCLFLISPQIEAGQYCTFVISSDGSVRACGKGSYGRLGLGDSNNQSTLKKLTFEPHRAIKKVSSSKGSDGHTLAFTTEGEVFSWGDGDYGKLGHGNSSTQKYPKLIQGPLQGKVWFHLTRGILLTWCIFLLCILLNPVIH